MSGVTDSVNVAPLPAWAARVVAESAASLVLRRVPFLHRGRTPAGLDCLGLILNLHERIGVRHVLEAQETHYSSSYYRHGGDALYLRGILARCVVTDRPAVGDVVAFRAAGSETNVGHAGVVVDPATKTYVHAYYARGVRSDRWTDRAWAKQVHSFMRPRAFSAVPAERV